MEAVVMKKFPGRPDHEIMTRMIEVGETISGDLAKVAVREGWAENEADTEVDGPSDEIDLKALTVKELTDLAVLRGIDLGSANKKNDIITAIRAAVVAE